MRRWTYTFLIIITLGLTVACGSKSSGGGSAPVVPVTPSDDDPVVPPTCTGTNCNTFQKVAGGELDISDFAAFKSLKRKYIGCDRYQSVNFFGHDIGGSWGSSNCDSWNAADFWFVINKDIVTVYMYIRCTDWTCGGTNTVLSGRLMDVKIAPIDKNTGYQFSGTVYNDLYRFRIEKQDLKGPIKVKVEVKIFGNAWANLGTVDAYDGGYY